ncbi:hypothetical protein MJL81_29180, partial [Salmonella enterica subsp. enterica serovar Anatum]|nr:hypothetical protein [Salmonella enterica subsp. enterica serovar Anatum]
VGIMGAGVLGAKVAESLQAWGFPLRCWSRSRKSWPGVESYVGIRTWTVMETLISVMGLLGVLALNAVLH